MTRISPSSSANHNAQSLLRRRSPVTPFASSVDVRPRNDRVTGHVVAGYQGSWLVRRLSASNMVMPCLAAVAV